MDDIGAYKKFHDRNASEFLCVKCFAAELKTTEDFLRERIAFLKRNGCLLFSEVTLNEKAEDGKPDIK